MLELQKVVLTDSIEKLKTYSVATSLQRTLDALDQDISNLKNTVKESQDLDKNIMLDIELLFLNKINCLEKVKPKIRVLEPYIPNDRIQDKIFPAEGDLSYQNYLIAVMDAKTDVQYNFKFSDGALSKVQAERALTLVELK